MAENLIIADGSKADRYALLYDQIKALAEDEKDVIANMANIASMIHQTFGFWWTGYYRVVFRAGPGTVPRTSGMQQDSFRTRSMRNCMEAGGDCRGSGCRRISGTYRLQQRVKE